MNPTENFLPQGREFTFIEPCELEESVTRRAYALWQELRGSRPHPRREELTMRDIYKLAPHLSLVRVINNGEDFEHRIVGDAIVRAFDVGLQNRLFSEVAIDAPKLVAESFFLFRKTVATGAPLAWRHRVVHDDIHIIYTKAEIVLLPLGEDYVDHIAAFGVHSRGAEPAA